VKEAEVISFNWEEFVSYEFVSHRNKKCLCPTRHSRQRMAGWMARRVKMAAEDGQRFAADSRKFMET
jgi:hypothetical protein